MKNSQNTNKVAGADTQVLPGNATGGASASSLPTQALTSSLRSEENGAANLNTALPHGADATAASGTTATNPTVDLPSLTEARMRGLDRTQEMVSLHAMRLVESNSNSLSVVIKPTIGTEISLELKQQPGHVEAQATVLRGDHDFLSSHWSDLQQRLKEKGIKLGSLGDDSDLTTADQGQYRDQQSSAEDLAMQAGAFAEFASASLPTAMTAATAVSSRDGWESWA